MNTTQLRNVAYHEAGHAVLAWLSTAPFRVVSVIPNYDDMTAGYVHSSWWVWQTENPPLPDLRCAKCKAPLNAADAAAALFADSDLRDEADRSIIAVRMLYGGMEAIKILTGRRDLQGAASDLKSIRDIAESEWSHQSAPTTRAMLKAIQLDAHDRLQAEWAGVVALADALVIQREMSEADAVEILKAAHWRRVLAARSPTVHARR